ncbi:MAG: cbb3-type cytochrome c oxidase subunit 3 [Alphaproteobacteria bacterium]|jgi:cytochrome c oxidase cbb3-type subunit IV|nr:cbb3-type cytochrome c oxidase subunit 3 [Alphaproteobacteria bacterium]MBU1549162.1 cbb3-type cytochrome c oxidase subunit 3 [Alphaproteobacteria bacterium]MBU2337037.1 cbb3-type cytochrome c oxidase subunit 3 [Alphaproteobacteria bacterium]MBU2388943.1 cbb3-type cytochrome c oxidase subunit 3 [Alphaproteobacteria bacterium]
MDLSHDTLVWVAKTFGLIYLLILSAAVLAYAFWPSRQKEFHHASVAILDREDRPWR